MTGTHWIDESGVLETPILITNTLSVGVVRDAVVSWMVKKGAPGPFWYPVVAETSDGRLNDQKGQHVKAEDAIRALESARGGRDRRRQRGRWHRHAVPRLQGRNRHLVAQAAGRRRRITPLARWCSATTAPLRASHRGHSGRPRNPGIRALRGPDGSTRRCAGGRRRYRLLAGAESGAGRSPSRARSSS